MRLVDMRGWLSRLRPRQVVACVALSICSIGTLGFWGYDHYLSNRRMVASIVPYNHTDTGIDDFYVDGTWGGISYPHVGGGRSLCCVTIPERWPANFKVTVKWEKDGFANQWLSRQVVVPRYDESGGELQVHFLRNDEIRVVVTNWDLRSPNNPLHKEFPW